MISEGVGGYGQFGVLSRVELELGRAAGHGADRALAQLRRQGYPVLDEDIPRLSPFVRRHIGFDGHYSFHLPDLGGTHRPLRDANAEDEE